MAKFQEGDKVRDRYTYAEGIVTGISEAVGPLITVEWLDRLGRRQVETFNERRLVLIETAAVASEGERVERRQVDDDEPERELRITAPAPAGGPGDPVVVDVSGEEPKLVGGVPEQVLDQLDDRVEAERERREFEGSTAEEDMDIAEEAAAPDSEPPDGDPLGRKPDDELEDVDDGKGPEPPA